MDCFAESYPDCRTLAVAFTGYGNEGVPAADFEFWAVLHRFHINRLFVLDRKQHWFMNGVEGYAGDSNALAAAIIAFAREHDINRIVTIGNCMGGFAALMIGGMIGAARSITFGGNFTTRPAMWEQYGDHRARLKLRELEDLGLSRDLDEQTPPFINFYDREYPCDRWHAEYLAGLPQGHVVHVSDAGHFTAQAMIRRQLLLPLLEDLLLCEIIKPSSR